jgi:hypothetical protein
LEARKGGSTAGHERTRKEFEQKTPQDYPILKLTEALDVKNYRTPVKITSAMQQARGSFSITKNQRDREQPMSTKYQK